MSEKSNYKRIVVKAGTSLLTDGGDFLNSQIIQNLVSQISELQSSGYQMVYVSSGAVAAGKSVLKSFSIDSKDSEKQVLAAIGQGNLIHIYEKLFLDYSIPTAQALLSNRDVEDRLGYLNIRNTLLSLIDHGVVPIVNENDVVAIDELSGEVFGDNDHLSALVANMLDADLLIILGRVEGMYDKDPNIFSDAKLISFVDFSDQNLESYAGPSSDLMGRGGMLTKFSAAKLATTSGVDVVIASGLVDSVIKKLSKGQKIGSFFPASVSHLESKKRWMLSNYVKEAKILIDDGALKALKNKSSLLPVGLLDVIGEFTRGEVISITDSNGDLIGMGITNYDSQDIKKIIKVKSENIQNVLGYHYGNEVVHRNNMVLM